MLSPEYLAGFFDGEGWISVGSSGRKSGNIIVGICNRDRILIEMIRVQFPNCSIQHKNESGNWAAIDTLQWSGLDCVQILSFIVDHLHIKKEAAILGIELAKLQPPKGKKPRVSEEMFNRRVALGSKIHFLVKKGGKIA